MAVVRHEKHLFQMIHRDKFGAEEWLEIVGDDKREFSLDKGAVSGLFCAALAHAYVISCASLWMGASSPVVHGRRKGVV